jgi:hypothetical protein
VRVKIRVVRVGVKIRISVVRVRVRVRVGIRDRVQIGWWLGLVLGSTAYFRSLHGPTCP